MAIGEPVRKRATKKTAGVWCLVCDSNIAASREAITRHLDYEHPALSSDAFVEKILANTSKKRFKRKAKKVRACPSGNFPDEQQMHEIRWAKTISAGAPGLGKRR